MATFAQDVSKDTSSQFLSEVTVTATRKPQEKHLIPYTIQSLSLVDLEKYQPRTTPEALVGLTGVFLQKTNHGGGSPFIRGLTGNQTLILVDGIRLNNSTFRYGPNQYLNTIDAYNINRIEVAKGTGSVQYGSDALGGVMQVFTKEPSFSQTDKKWKGKAVTKYMTQNMEKSVRGEGVYNSQKMAAMLGATYRDFGDLVGGDSTGKQSPSGYTEFAFDAKLKMLVRKDIQLILAHQFIQQQRVPLYHKVVLENFAVNEFHPQQRMLNYGRMNINTKNTYLSKVEFIASWQQTIEGRNSHKHGSNILRQEKDEVNTVGLTADITSVFSKIWTANSGIEIYADKVNSVREDVKTESMEKLPMRGLYPDDSRYKNYSVYSLHHLKFYKWLFEGGVRINSFSIRILDTSLGKVKLSPSCFVYNASGMYNISAQHHAYLTLSTGYRAPNVDDLGSLGIVDFRYEIPTNNLAPEKSRNIELGYKLQSRKLAANISGYYMRLDNIIARVRVDGQVINNYPVYRKENIEKAFIKGLEAEIDYKPIPALQFSAGLAYTYGQNLSKNEPLRRIPPLNGRMMSSYHKNRWFASAEFLFASKQNRLAQGDKEDNRIPAEGTPGWNVLNLFTGYQLRNFRCNLGLQNLFNEDYRYHGSGINGVGRSVWLSLSVQI